MAEIGLPYVSLTSGMTTRANGIALMEMKTGSTTSKASCATVTLPSMIYRSRKRTGCTIGLLVDVLTTIRDFHSSVYNDGPISFDLVATPRVSSPAIFGMLWSDGSDRQTRPGPRYPRVGCQWKLVDVRQLQCGVAEPMSTVVHPWKFEIHVRTAIVRGA